MILAFILAVIATAAGSDLHLPKALSTSLSIYLLLAIGFKGGTALAKEQVGDILVPLLVTIGLGVVTPLVAYVLAKRMLPIGKVDACALAAHYGSVSAVTFAAALTVLADSGVFVEGFAPALLALLEIPGIVVALTLAAGEVKGEGSGWGAALKEAVLGRSIVLLAGGLAIGWIAGPARMELVDPLFVDLFYGALTLFLIDLGVTVARRARSLKVFGIRLVAAGIVIPLINGTLGVTFATLSGLSVGGAAVVGIMAASASYIAAPAAVRIALPDANPALYLTAALGITFPFNIIVGIPLFFGIAQAIGG
jgi:hypothetical protein